MTQAILNSMFCPTALGTRFAGFVENNLSCFVDFRGQQIRPDMWGDVGHLVHGACLSDGFSSFQYSQLLDVSLKRAARLDQPITVHDLKAGKSISTILALKRNPNLDVKVKAVDADEAISVSVKNVESVGLLEKFDFFRMSALSYIAQTDFSANGGTIIIAFNPFLAVSQHFLIEDGQDSQLASIASQGLEYLRAILDADYPEDTHIALQWTSLDSPADIIGMLANKYDVIYMHVALVSLDGHAASPKLRKRLDELRDEGKLIYFQDEVVGDSFAIVSALIRKKDMKRSIGTKKRVHIVGKIPFSDEQLDYLKGLNVDHIANSNPTGNIETVLMDRMKGATAVVNNISTPITKNLIEANPMLEFIQTYSTGTDSIDLDAARAHDIQVANVPGFSTEAVAEATLCLMLMGARRFIEANRETVQKKEWNYTKHQGVSLYDKRVCLVGNGAISKKVADLLRPFNAQVDVVDTKTEPEDFAEYLRQADFVSVHCPLNHSTNHLISRREFEMMDSVILVNTARGGIVNEEDLIWALDNGKVLFACLDVLEHEPIRKDEPLLQHPRVFITPHSAWNTVESMENLNWRVIKNIERYLKGEPVEDMVTHVSK